MATLRELAERTGYSAATISRILSGDPALSVSMEARRKVLEEAGRLNYTATRSRRGRAPKGCSGWESQRCSRRPSSWRTPSTSISAALSARDVWTGSTPRSPWRAGERASCPRRGAAGRHDRHWKVPAGADRGDGGALPPDRLFELLPLESRFDSVVLNFSLGISMALEHLAELGHRSVGFIGPEWKLDDLGRRAPEVRRQLFSQQLEARGLECRDWLLDCPMETEAAARAVGERLSNGGTRPTALLAANEETAIGAIRALRLAGLDAPKDLSVVSFNDTPRSALVEPPLTSVSAHVEEMARTALRLLRERVALPGREPERTVPLKVVVPSSLTVRSSTGPVPAE